MASSDDTRPEDELQTPDNAATDSSVSGDDEPVIHQFLFNMHGSDRPGLHRRDASYRRPHLPVLKLVRSEDDVEDAAARDPVDDVSAAEIDEEGAESNDAMIGHFADDDEWESSEVAALAPHLVERPVGEERREAADVRPTVDEAAHADAPPEHAIVSVIEWAGGDMRAWRSQPPAPLHTGDQHQSHAGPADEMPGDVASFVEALGDDAEPAAPVIAAADSVVASAAPAAESSEACAAAPPAGDVDGDRCDAAAAHAAAVELAATADSTALHGPEAHAEEAVEQPAAIVDESDAAGSLEASPFWSYEDEPSVAADADVAATAREAADDDAIGPDESAESVEMPQVAASAGEADADGNVRPQAPQRVGSGRRIRRNFEWRPGDLFGDGPEPARNRFNWWQVWRTAAVTAACGVIAVLLVAR